SVDELVHVSNRRRAHGEVKWPAAGNFFDAQPLILDAFGTMSVMTARAFRGALIALLWSVGLAHAQEAYRVPEELGRRPMPPEGMDVRSARPLRLLDAIQIAVRQNLGVALTREQTLAAEAGVGVAAGRFEPTFTGVYSHSDADTPPTVMQLQQGISAAAL